MNNLFYFICYLVFCVFIVVTGSLTIKTLHSEPVKPKIIENNFDHYKVTVTAYSPSRSETDITPNLTAIHEKPILGGTVAVSRDLLKYLGNKVYIYQVGVFRVNDLMNKRYKKRIDICMGKEEAKKFGIKKEVKVVFIDD